MMMKRKYMKKRKIEYYSYIYQKTKKQKHAVLKLIRKNKRRIGFRSQMMGENPNLYFFIYSFIALRGLRTTAMEMSNTITNITTKIKSIHGSSVDFSDGAFPISLPSFNATSFENISVFAVSTTILANSFSFDNA